MKYFLQYREYRTGGELCEGEDTSDQFASYEDTDIQLDLGFVADDRKKTTSWCIQEFEVDKKLGKTCFLLVARYSSGDTFGRTSGHFDFLGLFATKKEAEEVILNTDKSQWSDYFGGFQFFEITELQVK